MSLKYNVYRNIQHSTIQYYRYGVLHRVGSPAIIYKNGAMFWYQYNGLHREDGPAVKLVGNEVYYYIRSNQYYKIDYESKIRNNYIN